MSAQDELPPGWSMTTRRRDGHWTVLCADGSPVFDPHGSHRGDAARAAWRAYGRTQAEEATMRAAVERCAELEALLRIVRAAPAVALLRKCRPFVWRALQGGKSPHVQDIEDAGVLWPLIKDLGGA